MLGGPRDYLFAEYDGEELIRNLYERNCSLTAQVQTLFQLLAYVYAKNGVDNTEFQKIMLKTIDENWTYNTASDPILEAMWKRDIKDSLGDVPGVEL